MVIAGSLSTPVVAQSLAPQSVEHQSVEHQSVDHQSVEHSQRAARTLVKAPPGFNETCRRYQWFCVNQTSRAGTASQDGLLDLAHKINRRVNNTVTQLSDPENYGVADYWTLPVNGNGDCEDFVLQKYKLLLDAGVDSRDMSIAVVLDGKGGNHAVLVLRHSTGDLVLDSLSRRIRPWNQTGYTYLAMQSSGDKTQWEVVMNQPRDSNVLALR
jgi:predicted transglutaminase-like cysteine proteinase